MKILHVVGNEYCPGNGIFTIVNDLISELNVRCIQADLLLLKECNSRMDYAVYCNVVDYFLFFQNHSYDLVVFHGLFFLAYRKISKVLVRLNIPYVIKPHSSLMKKALEKSFFKKWFALNFILRNFIRQAKYLVFSNREEECNSKIFEIPIVIETNGVNFDKIGLKDLGNIYREDGLRLLFLSRFDIKHKGIDYLVEGYKLYCMRYPSSKDVTLLLYGIGAKTDEKKVKKLIDGCSKIFMHGPVFGKEKNVLLENADALILTSRYEGFPTILIDALICGLPAIVTPGTNALFIESRNVGWITELDVEQIAFNIDRAVQDIKNGMTSKVRCRQFVLDKFDIHHTIQETIALYRSVIAN